MKVHYHETFRVSFRKYSKEGQIGRTENSGGGGQLKRYAALKYIDL